jgi:hypothetical protein
MGRVMKQITDAEYELFQQLQTIWKHAVPEQSGQYFICGSGGEKDEHGLPEVIMVCPSAGLNYFKAYKRLKNGNSANMPSSKYVP